MGLKPNPNKMRVRGLCVSSLGYDWLAVEHMESPNEFGFQVGLQSGSTALEL